MDCAQEEPGLISSRGQKKGGSCGYNDVYVLPAEVPVVDAIAEAAEPVAEPVMELVALSGQWALVLPRSTLALRSTGTSVMSLQAQCRNASRHSGTHVLQICWANWTVAVPHLY